VEGRKTTFIRNESTASTETGSTLWGKPCFNIEGEMYAHLQLNVLLDVANMPECRRIDSTIPTVGFVVWK
jgi:hypothetical protein